MFTAFDNQQACSINRNIVECKAYFPASIQTAISSINRNIVECKVYLICSSMVSACGINRNIVECKASNFKDSINESVVLIETSWNVKYAAAAELPDIGVMY